MSKAATFIITATKPMDSVDDTLHGFLTASTEDRGDAEMLARALRATGYNVEIRVWTKYQRKCQDHLGRWRWHAGYAEYYA